MKKSRVTKTIITALLALAMLFPTVQRAEAATISKGTPAEIIMIGDSRTVQMAYAVDRVSSVSEYYSYRSACVNKKGSSAYWSAKGGEGYEWMVNVGVPRVESRIKQNTAVVIWMGGNNYNYHATYAPKYITYIKQKAKAWAAKGARVYFASIGLDHSSKSSQNTNIRTFDNKLKSGLAGSDCKYIDMDTMTAKWDWSYYTSDGAHFSEKGSKTAWAEIKSKVNKDFADTYNAILKKDDYKKGSGTMTLSLNKGAGQVKVTLKGCPKAYQVKFPTWSVDKGQDDLKWYVASKDKSGNWNYTINLANHKSKGKFYVDCWIFRPDGSHYYLRSSSFTVNANAKGTSKAVKTSGTTFRVDTTMKSAEWGIARIEVAVWSKNKGQDDLKWYTMTKKGSAYTASVNIKNHKNEKGPFYADVWISDKAGNRIFISSNQIKL